MGLRLIPPYLQKVVMVPPVIIMMNAKVVFVKVEAVALPRVIPVMNIRIAADILLKAALMEPVVKIHKGGMSYDK